MSNVSEHAELSVGQLYETYRRPMLAHLLRLVNDPEIAEDLCQETFVKALRSWASRDAGSSAVAWLYRIATNTAYDFLRRRRRIQFMPLVDGAEHHALSIDLNEQAMDEREPVLAALARLPELYRTPLVWHSCEGQSTQEIARRLGVSNSAVKTRLFRARERFRQVYQG